MNTIEKILLRSETIVSMIEHQGYFIIATQTRLFKVWSEKNEYHIQEIAFG